MSLAQTLIALWIPSNIRRLRRTMESNLCRDASTNISDRHEGLAPLAALPGIPHSVMPRTRRAKQIIRKLRDGDIAGAGWRENRSVVHFALRDSVRQPLAMEPRACSRPILAVLALQKIEDFAMATIAECRPNILFA